MTDSSVPTGPGEGDEPLGAPAPHPGPPTPPPGTPDGPLDRYRYRYDDLGALEQTVPLTPLL